MFEYLSKLQNKSNKEKKKILVVSTFVIMFIIVVVWLSSLRTNINSDVTTEKLNLLDISKILISKITK